MSYYSGQGNIYVAERNADGTPKGFLHVGNVPSLEISIETTKFEHKEAMSGSRAIDLTIVQEKKGTFTMTMEDMDLDNLALGFWGTNATIAAGAAVQVNLGLVDVHATKEMIVPVINHASGTVYANLLTTTTSFDATSTPTAAYEFGESDEDLTNSKNGWIDIATGDVHIYSTAKQGTRGAATPLVQDDPLFVDFDHGSIDNMAAFTETSQQRWIRFSGLNTIDDTPVVIDMFKADLDPLTGYGLINEELSTFEMTGSLLYDELQAGTSKFFKQTVQGA